MLDEFSASDSTLGYFFQVRYALYLLMRAGQDDPEAQISIERFDDIAFESHGTPTELIQTKHHILKSGSLTDSSSDLWKTLRIWCVAMRNNVIQTDKAILTLITTERAQPGSIASKLGPVNDLMRDEESARKKLCHTAQTSRNRKNRDAYQAFLGLSELDQKALLSCIRIIDRSPNILEVEDRMIRLLRHSTRPKFLSPMLNRLQEWWIAKVIKHLTGQVTDVITHQELQMQLNDIQEQFREDSLPIDFPTVVEIDELDLGESERIFIEQLRLVGVGPERTHMALSDFYRGSEQRSRWVREHILPLDELIRYDTRLQDQWLNRFCIMKEDMDVVAEEDEIVKQGRNLYNWIQSQPFRIREKCVEEYIMRGSYHILSNSLKVGWHLDFKNRLEALLTKLESRQKVSA